MDFTESIDGSNQSKTSELQQRSLVGGVSWNRNWSDRFETTALLYGSYYLLSATNKDLFTTQQQFQENEVLEDGAKIDSRFTFSEKIKLQSGYQFSEIGIGNTQDVNIPRFRTYNKEVL
ncbi:MAG TPA: TonB-dependent receptor, partial [Flavobacteriaceae bacterium]|nr:TonB-dependent receptor [Flavobacteriaceae bacterium]